MVLLSDDGKSQLESGGPDRLHRQGDICRNSQTVAPPTCRLLAAFRPDRRIREDGPDSAVSKKLNELHTKTGDFTAKLAVGEHQKPRSLPDREGAVGADGEVGRGLLPPTYEVDGYYTHATAVPSRLITTANHFYQEARRRVCLRLPCSALKRAGIHVRDEQALPVGDQAVGGDWGEWVCPHIIGGIPPHVVDQVLPMVRDGPKFLGIEGL